MLKPALFFSTNRNFLGFAREIFTDAGKYVVHFGYAPNTAAAMAEKTLAIRSGKEDVHVTPLARLRTEVAVIPSVTGNQLVCAFVVLVEGAARVLYKCCREALPSISVTGFL